MNTVTMMLIAMAALEALVVYALVHYWRQKAHECAGCAGELATARAALAGVICHVNGGRHIWDSGNWAWAESVRVACWSLEGRYPEYHHPKRGTSYRVLMTGVRFNMSGKLRDGDEVTVYQDLETGKLSCRGSAEFQDGRFQLARSARAEP